MKWLKRFLMFCGAVPLVVIAIAVLVNLVTPATRQAAVAPATPAMAAIAVAPAPAAIIRAAATQLPADEQAVLAVIANQATAYDNAANDMAKGATRPARARALCAAKPNTVVRDWVGTVYSLSSNSDGKGVLEVQIAPSVYLETWNNDLSDMTEHTLINPNSALFAKAVALRTGQRVVFSGTLFAHPGDCWHEASMSAAGAMTEPEFVIRFSDIQPAP